MQIIPNCGYGWGSKTASVCRIVMRLDANSQFIYNGLCQSAAEQEDQRSDEELAQENENYQGKILKEKSKIRIIAQSTPKWLNSR